MEENVAEEESYKGFKIEIVQDTNAESPREWDNLGTMFCSHGKYTLGDEQFRAGDFNGWDEVEDYLIRERKAVVILPLYLYDHSGITMKTTPFGDRWDSGQVGFIFVTKEDLRKNFMKKQVTKGMMEKAAKVLEGEVETYDSYLTGDVYGFRIVKEEDGERVDACEGLNNCIDSVWGYFGDRKYMVEEAKGYVDDIIAERKEASAKQGRTRAEIVASKIAKDADYYEEE